MPVTKSSKKTGTKSQPINPCPSPDRSKVVIINDDEFLAKIYKYKLENQGFRVACLYSSKTTVDDAVRENPDLVIMDLDLSKCNALETLGEFNKTNGGQRPVPIVMLSRYRNDEERRKALISGAADFLVATELTPFEMLKRVRKILCG